MPVQTHAAKSGSRTSGARANGRLQVALPEPGLSMTQDAEWCVVRVDNQWRQIRFHDYEQLYSVPGLYEKVIYDILGCDSPHTVRDLLETELRQTGTPPDSLRVLDLGAGNGMVAEELADLGVPSIVGVDLINEAAAAARRDRPSLYRDYFVTDMTRLNRREQQSLSDHEFNTLVCVAALGFGDIPPAAFAAAFDLIATGGWIAFTIKEDFLGDEDRSGFAGLIQSILADGTLELRQRRRYQHRLATNRKPLFYEAIIGVKRRDLPTGYRPE